MPFKRWPHVIALLVLSASLESPSLSHVASDVDSELASSEKHLPLALARFPESELRDVDCERVRSGIVNWNDLKESIQKADDEWQFADQLPQQSCASFLETQEDYSDVLVVMARSTDAAAECALGALAAVLVLLVCAAECPAQASEGPTVMFETLWRAALTGARALPVYMLGTSSWPVASLLAKWQAHCMWEAPAASRYQSPMCSTAEVLTFSSVTQSAANDELMPLLWRVKGNMGAPERALGNFAYRIFKSLAVFMNSAVASPAKPADECAGAAVAQGCLLLLFRLLGPPVTLDPLHVPRLTALGKSLAQLSLAELVQGLSWPSLAVLATSRHLTWRTHRIYRLEVPFAEVRRVLEKTDRILRERSTQRPRGVGWKGDKLCENLRGDIVARRKLWDEVVSDIELGALWHQLARWLRSGEEQLHPRSRQSLRQMSRTSSPVFLTMGFGYIEDVWLHGFLNRALDVRLKRLIFVTPDKSWLLRCEQVRQERKAEQSLLCVRTFNPQARPYDHNNKAKFYLYPILLSLGVDIAWLDLDIFVFKDPSHRLLEQAYGRSSSVKDVLVTDHFDEHCLNHGVFMVRASDRSLLWILRYIEWLHWYPYGHDQNGWDAFLAHSIVEPQLPDNLRTDPAINVSYAVLSTEFEYVTLTGWSGVRYEQALLLHYTTTRGISFKNKKKGIVDILNATAKRFPDDEDGVSGKRLHTARWKALHKLQAARPMTKRPCYEGIHMVVGQLLESGFYDELLS